MGDFGSATHTTTNNSFEPFNADIFKDKTQDLNESKDSDEGFSSSFSPTSETSIMQEQAITTSLHLWGNNNDSKEEPYLMTPMAVNPVNTPFQTTNSRRVVQAPSPLGQVRKPTPALSNYLAANKAVANSLGVSSWTNQQPQQTQVSSWPSQQQQPQQPIGTSGGMNSNWNNNLRNNPPNFPVSIQLNHAQQIALQQQRNMLTMNKSNVMPNNHGHGNHAFYQHQQAVLASVQAKNLKNRNFSSPLSMNATNGTNSHPVHQNSMANINSGLDATIVDDITQLTSSFSNLTATSDQGGNNSTTNGFFSNQVSLSFIVIVLS